MTYEGGSSSNQGLKQDEEIELVTIDVEGGEKVVKNLLDRVNINDTSTFSPIYKAPGRFRDLSPISFTPRVVSIGPMHKENTNFKSMEKKKPSYLATLLSEVDSREDTLKNCEKKVRDKIEKIKRYYFDLDKLDKKYTDNELVEMMVMDGCFILQFIFNLSVPVDKKSENRLRSRSTALDLVLLENQIPFFVLQDIYECVFNNLESKPSLITMLCILLDLVNPFKRQLNEANLGPETNHYHILGLLHKFYHPINIPIPTISVIPSAHSVVNLARAGVKFRSKDETYWPREKENWPMAMEFEQTRSPILRMPVVCIDNFFEVVIRNLIVFEQYSPVINHVTSYAMAMDMLANSPADIAKLGQSKIIINHLGSNEKASNMINNICKDVTFVDFYYIDPWQKMDNYYHSIWARNLAVLKQTHFSTPWKVIALIAAIAVFVITLVQFAFFMRRKCCF